MYHYRIIHWIYLFSPLALRTTTTANIAFNNDDDLFKWKMDACLVSCNVVNRCHPYAQCIYVASSGSYECRCNPGYGGDGMECIKAGTLSSLNICPETIYIIWEKTPHKVRSIIITTTCVLFWNRGFLYGSGHLRPKCLLPTRRINGSMRLQSWLRRGRYRLQSNRCFDISFIFHLYTKTIRSNHFLRVWILCGFSLFVLQRLG